MITSSNIMALNNHCATALGPRLGLGLRLDFGSQVWFVQYFRVPSENLVVVLYAGVVVSNARSDKITLINRSALSNVIDGRFYRGGWRTDA